MPQLISPNQPPTEKELVQTSSGINMGVGLTSSDLSMEISSGTSKVALICWLSPRQAPPGLGNRVWG